MTSPEHHTSLLPVLSDTLRAEWQAAGNDVMFRNIQLSAQPSVLGETPISAAELRVWRRDLSPSDQTPDARASVQYLLERMGGDVVNTLLSYFGRQSIGLSQEGALQAKRGLSFVSLDPESLTARFKNENVAVEHVAIVARDLLSTLKTVLLTLPQHTNLIPDRFNNSEYLAEATETGMSKEHLDGHKQLLLHHSDPGTPYSYYENSSSCFRTQGGDVSIHGERVWHGFATAPGINGRPRPRFCLGFKVSYAR